MFLGLCLFLFPRFLKWVFFVVLCFRLWFLQVYPKVKVKEQIEEAGQYAYEKSSLLSLKAFEWLSAHHFSPSDESPHLVVRIPGSIIPKSPPPTFCTPKEETSKKDNMGVEENRKNARANSAPRPRAVLSSPEFDPQFCRIVEADAVIGVLESVNYYIKMVPTENRGRICKNTNVHLLQGIAERMKKVRADKATKRERIEMLIFTLKPVA